MREGRGQREGIDAAHQGIPPSAQPLAPTSKFWLRPTTPVASPTTSHPPIVLTAANGGNRARGRAGGRMHAQQSAVYSSHMGRLAAGQVPEGGCAGLFRHSAPGCRGGLESATAEGLVGVPNGLIYRIAMSTPCALAMRQIPYPIRRWHAELAQFASLGSLPPQRGMTPTATLGTLVPGSRATSHGGLTPVVQPSLGRLAAVMMPQSAKQLASAS